MLEETNLTVHSGQRGNSVNFPQSIAQKNSP